MPRQVLTNFTLWVEDQGYIGQCKELAVPEIAAKTLDYVAGGLGGGLKVPLAQVEAMEASFELSSYSLEAVRSMGFVWGKTVPVDGRGAISVEDGSTKPARVHMRGHITKCESGAWKAGDEVTLSCTMDLVYYRLEQDGETLIEIDIDNAVLIVNGEDQLAEQRAAMGI